MIKTLREPASFRGWLLTIARRIALQHNESLCRQDRVLKSLASESVSEGEDQTVQDAEDLRQQLHQALRQLPERYRLPLTLRYLEQYNYDQIAQVLGLTDGSLRGLLNRGMKQLRGMLNPDKEARIE
jgi:RNA polymerase sigma-70 factor (ECF subfamily)